MFSLGVQVAPPKASMAKSEADTPQPIEIAHQVFHDIDELEVVSRANAQRNISLTQLSLERLHCEFIMVDFGVARLSFGKPNCPVQCTGSKVKGAIDFACVLDHQQSPLIAHGHRVSFHTFSGLDAHLETNVVVPANQVFVTLQVQRSLVEDCAEALNRPDLNAQYWHQNFVFAPETLPTVKAYLRELLTVTQQQRSFLQRPACRQLILDDLLPLVIAALPAPQKSVQGLTAVTRADLVQQAETYICDHLDQPLTVKSLCEALYVSKRTLFYAFEEIFGIGPMAYLKLHRLQAVRRALKGADPETVSVRAIMEQFGFWSPGHFARDYKTMFGQTPRQTLKQAQK